MGNHIASMGKICIDLIYSDVERLPKLGEEVFSKGFTITLGGGPPATMIALHRLGIPVKLGTFLGEGQFSRMAQKWLKDSHVNYINLYQGDEPEPLIITSVISTGEDRSFVSFQPGNPNASELEKYYATESQVYEHYKGCRIAYATLGYEDVWKRLKKEGSLLVMDAAWHDDMHIDWYKNVFPYIDYFTPNEKEAPKLTNTSTPEEALDVLAEYIPNPIVKLSKNGCIIKENGKTVHIKAANQFVSIDATGAGDAFLAGLMYGIYKGYSTRDSVILGNISGGNSVTQIGCIAADMDEESLQKYYESFHNEL
ncbi:MAG TPA: carbohydrate kinase family protein [Anaerovoracaceae bacterium]|nr:carbohydrate kinase family protein [Anaerovoracaceae bacterium]